MHTINIAAKDHPFFPGNIRICQGRGQKAEAVKSMGPFHLPGKPPQRIRVIQIGPGHIRRNQGDVADILVHDGKGSKLNQQFFHIFLGF